MWIQNVSRQAIKDGYHYDPGENSMLIQISDPPGDHPQPRYPFKEIYQFDFLDVEQDGLTNDGCGNWTDVSEFKITDLQARDIVAALKRALEMKMNVITHCHAGICRSGAVVEVGVMMGFEDLGSYRQPNLLVKHKLLKALGWTY